MRIIGAQTLFHITAVAETFAGRKKIENIGKFVNLY